jgi:hypothetical protein
MTKPSINDEINLVELVQIFWLHRIKFIVMGLLGLILGLSFTFNHAPVYTTDFKFSFSHPYFNDSYISNLLLVKSKLDYSELNKDTLPNYSLNRKNGVFTIKSKTAENEATIELFLKDAIVFDLEKLNKIAESSEGYEKKQIITNEPHTKLINFTNQDLANLNINDLLDNIKINLSETKALYPKPFKHGLIGFFIGLILGFVWMILAYLIGILNLNNPKRKT